VTETARLALAEDDPFRDDVRALLDTHLAFCRATSPPEDVHALDHDRLREPEVTFFSAREDGLLLGVGALKQLEHEHMEVKSMHTSAEARGRGVGRAMLEHLLAVAAARGAGRVSLETGSMEEFLPARSLYASAGFVETSPFADYEPSPNSTFMTLELPA
jgi:putative acetyltransferase